MADDMTDEGIMKDVQRGRAERLAILFERHHVKLYNFFLRLCGNRNTSEDLVQEVFLRILKYCGTYREEGSFTVWMYQIARNVHIDRWRKDPQVDSMEDQWLEPESSHPGPYQNLEQESDLTDLRRALAMLPLKKREVLVLSRFQNMKYKEIAKLRGCSISAVKLQIHRGMKDLQKIYAGIKGGA
jgi:RNA polymerase sigma-70 factor (ECF subfamily)